jgi:hypothetical protein
VILDTIIRPKRFFNVRDKKDINAYAEFLKTYSWKHTNGCPYILEFPYLTIPDMIKDKVIHKVLGVN